MIRFSIIQPEVLKFTIDTASAAPTIPYTGEYEFTPTQQTQEIQISGKTALQNIVINPIPQNYGLITHNGFAIMVS